MPKASSFTRLTTPPEIFATGRSPANCSTSGSMSSSTQRGHHRVARPHRCCGGVIVTRGTPHPDDCSLTMTGLPLPGEPFLVRVTRVQSGRSESGTEAGELRKYPHQDLRTGFAGYGARDRERGETGFALSVSATLTGAGSGSPEKPAFRKCA